jgi:TolB protein
MSLNRRRSCPLLLVAALLAWAPPAARAQESTQLEGVVEYRGFQQIKIAIPDPVLPRGSEAVASAMLETLRDDLDFSGFFDIVDPQLYQLVPQEGQLVRHEDWLSIGADALLLTRLDVDLGRIDFEAWLYDNTTGTQLLGKRYGGDLELARRVAHKLSDELVLHYTGRSGIALTRIAFVSAHGQNKEIYLVDYDGRRLRRLTTSDSLNLSPVWSPDGRELAFVSWRGRQPGVYVMSSEGQLGVLNTVGGEFSSSPGWSPSGRELAYAADLPGNTEIYLLDRRTGKNRRLTFNPAIDTSPSISPNGREIAFTSDRTGTPQIYVMDVDGVNVRRVSWTGAYNESAVWSPSGDRLAYASRVDGRFQIAVLDLGSGEVRQLTRAAANHENPAWAPDGRHLVFASDATGSYQIYTMRADGTRVRQLTRGPASFTPDWSR